MIDANCSRDVYMHVLYHTGKAWEVGQRGMDGYANSKHKRIMRGLAPIKNREKD